MIVHSIFLRHLAEGMLGLQGLTFCWMLLSLRHFHSSAVECNQASCQLSFWVRHSIFWRHCWKLKNLNTWGKPPARWDASTIFSNFKHFMMESTLGKNSWKTSPIQEKRAKEWGRLSTWLVILMTDVSIDKIRSLKSLLGCRHNGCKAVCIPPVSCPSSFEGRLPPPLYKKSSSAHFELRLSTQRQYQAAAILSWLFLFDSFQEDMLHLQREYLFIFAIGPRQV